MVEKLALDEQAMGSARDVLKSALRYRRSTRTRKPPRLQPSVTLSKCRRVFIDVEAFMFPR